MTDESAAQRAEQAATAARDAATEAANAAEEARTAAAEAAGESDDDWTWSGPPYMDKDRDWSGPRVDDPPASGRPPSYGSGDVYGIDLGGSDRPRSGGPTDD
ncbi:MAG TPA: hypothetical protein VFY84_09215 [Jiangellales bacterium]|nr:hypothetical protein [Jiangellales bacterium]